MLLREMKDLKRSYRENYDRLKQSKIAIADAQQNIDGMKQQIVLDFERWYLEEFEPSSGDQPLSTTLLTYPGSQGAAEDLADEEADAYLKAKRNVDTLHRAKKMEKMRPGAHNKK
jgi:hypothetical protein